MTDGGQVKQIGVDQLGKNPLGLKTVLFSGKMIGDADRVEAAAISIKEGCAIVWRFSDAHVTERNASLDTFMALVSDWQRNVPKTKPK